MFIIPKSKLFVYGSKHGIKVKKKKIWKGPKEAPEFISMIPINRLYEFFGHINCADPANNFTGEAKNDSSSSSSPPAIPAINIPSGVTSRTKKNGYSAGSLRHFLVAIRHFYKQHNLIKNVTKGHWDYWEIPMNEDQKLNLFLRGYKRKMATLKADGVIHDDNAKVYLRKETYIELCKHLFKIDLELWAYCVLDWNLLCRSETTSRLQMKQLRCYESDSIVIIIHQSKGQQLGQNSTAIHLYANPLNPFVCPFFALAILIFGYDHNNNSLSLFNSPARSTQELFFNAMKKVLPKIADFMVDSKDYGSHSMRKGAINYLNSIVQGPNALAVCLRADWKILGSVLSRYVIQTDGSDQYCGRLIALLDHNGAEFATLPPRFPITTEFGEQYWQLILGLNDIQFDCIPSHARQVLPLLLATFVNNYEFIKTNLSSSHSLRHRRITQEGEIKRLQQVLIPPRIKHEGDPSPTGVSPTSKLIQQNTEMMNMINDLMNNMKQRLDEWDGRIESPTKKKEEEGGTESSSSSSSSSASSSSSSLTRIELFPTPSPSSSLSTTDKLLLQLINEVKDLKKTSRKKSRDDDDNEEEKKKERRTINAFEVMGGDKRLPNNDLSMRDWFYQWCWPHGTPQQLPWRDVSSSAIHRMDKLRFTKWKGMALLYLDRVREIIMKKNNDDSLRKEYEEKGKIWECDCNAIIAIVNDVDEEFRKEYSSAKGRVNIGTLYTNYHDRNKIRENKKRKKKEEKKENNNDSMDDE